MAISSQLNNIVQSKAFKNIVMSALLTDTNQVNPMKKNYKSGSKTSTRTKRKSKYGRGQSLKAKILKTHPAKHLTLDSQLSFVHNGIWTCSPTQGITQGNTNQQRDGYLK